MGIAALFRSAFTNVDLTKFGPTHWNALRDLVTRILDTPTDVDGYVLTRDSTSANGAKWAAPGGGGAAPSGTGYAHVTAGAWDVPAAIAEANVTGLVTDLGTLTTAVAARELTANKNAASGYAGLSAGSKLTGSQQAYGATANTACEGNDARLSDARTPSAHVHVEADVTNLVADLAARATLTGAQVLTNKQLSPRVQAVTSAATVTPSPDTDDLVVVTAQAAALILANPTPVVNVVQGQKLIVRIKDNGTARAITYCDYGAANAASAGAASNNVWQTGVAVYTSSTARQLYLNGVSGTVDTASATVSDIVDTRIGCVDYGSGGGGDGDFFSGDVADVAMWSAALTAAEVTAYHAGVSPLLIRPGSLIGYWPLLGTASPEVDLRGRLELTLVNAPTASPHPRVFAPVHGQVVSRALAAGAVTGGNFLAVW